MKNSMISGANLSLHFTSFYPGRPDSGYIKDQLSSCFYELCD